jgi:EpsI family protein
MNPINLNNRLSASIRYGRISLLAIAVAIAYSATIIRLVTDWSSDTGALSLVLLAISLYLLWTRRNELKQLSPQPAIVAGSAVMLLGCLTLIVGRLSDASLLQDTSLPVTIMGIVLLTGGTRYVRPTWLSIVYLLFAFGFFNELLGSISMYLQYTAAWTAYRILQLVGMPVVLRGVILQLPHITLEVENGCSGQKHILALMALAVPLVFIRHPNWLPRLLLICLAFIIGVFANGLRIAIIGLWTSTHGGSVHGPYDVLGVSLIFFFGLILFLLASWAAETYWPGKPRQNKSRELKTDKENPVRSRRVLSVVAFGISILILCGTAIVLQLWKPHPASLKQPLTALSMSVGAWSGQDLNTIDSPLKDMNPDGLLYRQYANLTGQRATVNIAYFASQDEERKVVSYRNAWLSEGMEVLPLVTDQGTFFIGKTIKKRGKQGPEIVYFWFDIDGDIITDRYIAKIGTIRDTIIKHRTNGAVIFLSFPKTATMNEMENKAFVGQIFPLIRKLLQQTV